jgi:hypothetical protein
MLVENRTEEDTVLTQGEMVGTWEEVKEVVEDDHPLLYNQPEEITDDMLQAAVTMIDEVWRPKYLALLKAHRNVFAPQPSAPPGSQFSCEIDTQDAKPVAGGTRRLAPLEKKAVSEHTATMLKNKIIVESSSPWAAPTVMVRKKDGTLRFCVDFRGLNKVTVGMEYPIPRVDDTLDELGGSHVFSSMDLASGYWQLPMRAEDRQKTAFRTHEGLYEFLRMPFGIKNGPAIFQKAMNTTFGEEFRKFVRVYIDDIVAHSVNHDDHLRHLQKVFTFGSRRITFLGHVVDEMGVRPDESNVAKVRDMAPPTTVREIRRFLGLANYYRRFIRGYADMCRPLYDLLQADATWQWGTEQQEAFLRVKAELVALPLLYHPRFEEPFVIACDASTDAIGAILQQHHETGLRPIAYWSRTLRGSERNYSPTEVEMLAIVEALKRFRPYVLNGQRLEVHSDHRALSHLMNSSETTPKLARWRAQISEYNPFIVYKKGSEQAHVDCLSRPWGPSVATVVAGTALPEWSGEENWSTETPDEQKQLRALFTNIGDSQEEDPQVGRLVKFLKNKEVPEGSTLLEMELETSRFVWVNGKLWYIDKTPLGAEGRTFRLVIPEKLKGSLLECYHEHDCAGHGGIQRTLWRVRRAYWWIGLAAGYIEGRDFYLPSADQWVDRAIQ